MDEGGAYTAVLAALTEINEHNPRRQYMASILELWTEKESSLARSIISDETTEST